MREHVGFVGGREVEATLLELSTRSAQSVGRFALRKVATEMKNLAQIRVRKKSGLLAKKIYVKVDRGRDRSKIFASVRIKGDAPYRLRTTNRRSRIKGKLTARRYDYQVGSTPEVYGAFLEFGAPAHNMPPYPWMRTTWEELGGQRAVNAIGQMLGQGIEREGERISKGKGSRLRGIGYGGKAAR